MELPRLRIKSELWLPAHAIATAVQDPNHICNLHHSSQQHWIISPLSEARDRTQVSWMLVRFVTAVPPWELLIFFFFNLVVTSNLKVVYTELYLLEFMAQVSV